jgi:DivIVA domain-containing protein
MTGDQVRDTLFWPPYLHGTGYDAGEVDDLVRRVAAEFDAGQPAGPVIENATLRRRMRGRRYDIDAVDWFLSQLLLPLGHVELAGIGADPWGDLARRSRRH